MADEALLQTSKPPEPLTVRDRVFGCGGIIPLAARLPLIVSIWVVVGVTVMMNIEGFGIVTAIYVITQIVTTVGYGDVTVQPKSQNLKLFLGFYCLFGVAVAAEMVNIVCSKLVDAADERARKQMREIESRLSDGGTAEDTWFEAHKVKVNRALVGFGLWMLCIVFGTVYFGFWDNCVCADGLKPCDVELQWSDKGCPLDERRTLIDAFYMCCITLTTIGFGDQAPQTRIGRAVAAVWMVVGCAATVNFIAAMSAFFAVDRKKIKALNRELYSAMEKDDQGRIDKSEFLKFMLLRYEMVEVEDIEFILEQFRTLDANKSGMLDLGDLPCRAAAKSKLHQAASKLKLANMMAK